MYRYEYICIFSLVVVAFFLVFTLFLVSYFTSPRKIDSEKISAYECGYNPFEDSRIRFDIKFYLVSILFVIFDLEIIYLFPWAITLKSIGYPGFFSMVFFLTLLTIGVVYEWKKGALDWD